MSNFSENIIKTAKICAIFAAKLQIFISYFGVFLNILHFLILSNKKLRHQSVNVLLIGIAISDFLFLMFYFDGGTRDFLQAGVPYECRPPKSLLLVYWTQILQAFRDIFQRVSAYLGMFLALLRYLVMKYGTIRKTFLSPSDCWKLFILLILISSLITCFFNLKLTVVPSTKWRPPSSCTMYPANSTVPGFGTIQTDFYKDFPEIFDIFILFDGTLKLLPPISYIFLAIGLVQEFKKAEQLRKLFTRKDEMNNVTSLIILMTVTYFLAETPWAIVKFLQLFEVSDYDNYGLLIDYTAIITFTFLIINSSIHCIFCFLLSSEYRLVFWRIIWRKKRNIDINVPTLRILSPSR